MVRSLSLVRSVVLVVVTLVSLGALVRAASLTSAYEAEVQRLRQQWASQQQAEGLSGSAQRAALYAKYPTPELTLAKVVSLTPGGSGKLALSGKFTPQTAFLLENDQVTLGSPVVGANTLSATVTVAADAVPGFARLYAYAPVSGAYAVVPAVFVGVPPTFSLTATNGWTVSLVPEARTFALDGANATAAYKASFRKPGESEPFQTATGTLTLDANRTPTNQWSFSITPGEAGSAMEELLALQQQLGDPQTFLKMTDAQREALSEKMEALSERMAKETEAMVADPSAAQRKQDAFGCQYVSLTLDGRDVRGSISCGKDVGSLQVTGTRQ